VLTLDAGDYSMGTPFAAATRELGGELQLMGRMGFDATTFGNREFDLGRAVLASHRDFSGGDPALANLRHGTAQLMAPQGTMDASGIAMAADGAAAPREIKQWQAIMDHLRRLPALGAGQLPVIPVDARAAEVRAIKLG
jgi:hypothetical protein